MGVGRKIAIFGIGKFLFTLLAQAYVHYRSVRVPVWYRVRMYDIS